MVSSNPVVLVTGASRGIGLSTVQYLLQSGLSSPTISRANVITLSRSLPSALADLQKNNEGALECVQGDILDESVHEQVVKRAVEKWGRLDAVILNAGVIEFGRIADASPSSIHKQITTNLTSLFTTLHYSISHLRSSPTGLGRVIIVSSGAAVGNYASWGAYNASKAGVNTLARTLANEEGGKLAVWSIRPGVVDTEMQADIRNKGESTGMDGPSVQKFKDLHSQGKLVQPEDPAHVLAALAVRGQLENPKTNDGKGAGREGAFLSWEEEVLKEFRRGN
ncbi:unnamed protein product [Sympodiomycopsis kandeliae]